MSRQTDSIELAQRTAHGDLDAEARAWLSDAFARWLAGQDLHDALLLDSSRRLRARNRALREAADHLDAGASRNRRAELLALAILRFEARILPLVKRNPSHPLGPVDTCLLRVFASGHRIPRTQRGLFDALA